MKYFMNVLSCAFMREAFIFFTVHDGYPATSANTAKRPWIAW